MAIKYLAGKRMQGTAAERAALNLSTPPQTGWKELGRTTLGSAGDSINVASFAAKDNLMVLTHALDNDNTIIPSYQFNGDTGNNYAFRHNIDGGSDGTATSSDGVNKIQWQNDGSAQECFGVGIISNLQGKEKLVIQHMVSDGGAGAGNDPQREENVGKWANTSAQITTVNVMNTQAGDFASGSEVVVLGCDDDEADSGTNFWQELADVSVSSGSTIDTGTITAKKYLYIQLYTVPNGTSYSWLQFNSDTGSNYASRYSTNNGGESTGTSSNDGVLFYAPFNESRRYMDGYIVNKSDKEKMVIGEGNAQNTAGAGNGTDRRELYGKWANTSDSITSIQVKSKSGAFAAGTRLRVWGAN